MANNTFFSDNGGASTRTPQGGFNDSSLNEIFSQRVARHTAPAVALPASATSNSQAASSSSSAASGSSPSTGAIAGGVVGGIAAIAAIAGFAFWYLRRRRRGWNAGRAGDGPPVEKPTIENMDKKHTPPHAYNPVLQEMTGDTYPAAQEMSGDTYQYPVTQEMPADSSYKPKPRELDTGVAPVAELPTQQSQSPTAR